jgi:heat shock protein HtpX
MGNVVGLQTSIWNNNLKSIFLLISFPCVIASMVWITIYAFNLDFNHTQTSPYFDATTVANQVISDYALYILGAVLAWFAIAWFSHQNIINKETGARPLQRNENPDIYNLLENLCISRGIKTPKLFIIDAEQMNAYASGINDRTYAITLTQGLINRLERDELEAVIAHELTHILNKDVRLLIISIVFVGIISVLSELLVRKVLRGGVAANHSQRNDKGHIIKILIVIAVAAIGYGLAILVRFALSRRREYLADAGAVELTKNSDALIRALQKISGNSHISTIDNDVQQMMFDNQKSFMGMFATHPPIQDRIAVLKHY